MKRIVPVFEMPKAEFKTLDSAFLPRRKRALTFRNATREEIKAAAQRQIKQQIQDNELIPFIGMKP